ncbi:MAG: DUF350 domain-containing protein [Calditrichia bacterium]|nr:DUF350 domain-containing protein [Calditrichia bacterium]
MTLDMVVTGIIYLVAIFVLFIIGKFVYDKTNPRFNLKYELVEKDNFAMALAVVGYYFGLVMALGGVLLGDSSGWINDLIDIFMYGLLAIVLLNISVFINDKVILYKFDNIKEIIDDKNPGTGIVEAGNHIANGLILYGALSGEGGIVTALAFWFLGQIVLVLITWIYNLMTPYDLHKEIEKDNTAVGIAFSGALIAIGNIIRIGIAGDFISWQENLTTFALFVVFGVVLMPILRLATDKILLPGRKLTDELVNQEKANLGAGAIEAFSYIAASFMLGWVV